MNPEQTPKPPAPTTWPESSIPGAVRSYALMTQVSTPESAPRTPNTGNAAVQSLLTMRRHTWKKNHFDKTIFRKTVSTSAVTTAKTLFGSQLTSLVGLNTGVSMSSPLLAGLGLNAGLFGMITGGLLLTSGFGMALGLAIGGFYKFHDWKKQEDFDDALFQIMANRAEMAVIRGTED